MNFDFRWLRIRGEDLHKHPTAIAWGDTGFFHVLQIRTISGPRGEEWWNDWSDIPVVEQRS